MILTLVWISHDDAPSWLMIVGPVALAVYLGRILLTFAWGIWFQAKTGRRLRFGYGGWYEPRRRRR
jgi:hypothetical protein